jgi:small basic protein (TIGR04137 family)
VLDLERAFMTMDRTLKSHGGLAGARSVLTRAERILHMTEEGKFDPLKNSPFGLPKVKVKHSRAGTKTKKAAEETPAEGAAPAEGGAAAPAAGAAGKTAAAGKAPAAKAPVAKAPAAKADAKKK